MSQHRIHHFLKLMHDSGASDLHLSVGRPPNFRQHGTLEPIRYRTISPADFVELVRPIAPGRIWDEFQDSGDADFAHEVEGLARFRVNLSRQHRGASAVFRIIPTRLLTIEQLGLPSMLRKAAYLRSGLFLVTGPTGSGKSTTLAAIIHEVNLERPLHFITIEDPIEFVHENAKCLMSQREVGTHADSFEIALRAAIREDPDAVLVGEMRDRETIRLALDAAELGVLVFATLHTNSAARTVDRIVSVFPTEEQDGIRGSLAAVIKGVVSQQLVSRKAGGRTAAVEILLHTPALSALIREGKAHQIGGLIQTGRSMGMVSMEDALRTLVESEEVEPMAALEKAGDKEAFANWLRSRVHAAAPQAARPSARATQRPTQRPT